MNVQQQTLQNARDRFFNFLKIDLTINTFLLASAIWEIGVIRDLQAGHGPISASNISAMTFLDNFQYAAILTWIGVGIGLYKWLVDCYEFSKKTLGASGFTYEKYIALAWLGPVVVYRPYRILKEIFQAGGANYSTPDGWKQEKGSGQLLSWWIFWAISHFIGFALAKIYREQSNRSNINAQQLLELVSISIFVWAMSIVISLLWFWVAGELTERLLARVQMPPASALPLQAAVRPKPNASSAGNTPRPQQQTAATSQMSFKEANVSLVSSDQLSSVQQSLMAISRGDIAPAISETINDEVLYEQALNELGTNKKPGLWAKALAQTANGGNPDGVYIALRVAQLRQESEAQNQEQQLQNALALEAMARDSRHRLRQQGFFDSVESAQRGQVTCAQFAKQYNMLAQHKNPLDARKLVWLCDYEIWKPGDDPSLPSSYIVRKSSSDEPVAVFKTEHEFVNWAITAFAIRQPTDSGCI
jgi:Domain of unknown function (DUF4328)